MAAPDRSAILSRLVAVIVDQFAVDAGKISESTSFEEDLDVDSLEWLQLFTAVEDEFSLTIPDDRLGSIISVRDAVDTIIDLGADDIAGKGR